MLEPNWPYNQKRSEFNEIRPNWHFKYADFNFNVKKFFMTYLSPVRPKLVSKIKNSQHLLKFGTVVISMMPLLILMSKIIFMKYLLPVRPKLVPKFKMFRFLMKFGTFDISNMSVSILVSKMIFIKYLPPVRPKLVQKLRVPKIYWKSAQNLLKYGKFDILIITLIY